MIKFQVISNQVIQIQSSTALSIEQFKELLKITKSASKHINFFQVLQKDRPAYIKIQEAPGPAPCAEKPEIIYEDETCLVAYKPSNLLIHSDGSDLPTLTERVNGYLYDQGFPFEAKACHRLDVETCGLVLFCKIPFLQNFFDEQFRNRKIIKEYYLLVHQNLSWKKKTIDRPISRNRHDAKKMITHPNGKEAKTIFETIHSKNGYTLLKATLINGRKHQIRVHSASAHFPIVNDPLYNPEKKNGPMLLECFHLGFISAQEQKKIDLKVDLDPAFFSLMKI